jgi:hypothetical protein
LIGCKNTGRARAGTQQLGLLANEEDFVSEASLR